MGQKLKNFQKKKKKERKKTHTASRQYYLSKGRWVETLIEDKTDSKERISLHKGK